MKQKGASHANAERRRSKVFQLTLHGWSQEAIGLELVVSQQTVSRDQKIIGERLAKIWDQNLCHTYGKSYAMRLDLLMHHWSMFEESTDPVEKRKTLEGIGQVMRDIDDRFLPTNKNATEGNGKMYRIERIPFTDRVMEHAKLAAEEDKSTDLDG